MSDATAEHFETQDSQAKQAKLKGCALRIRNDFHFKRILLEFEVSTRRAMYDFIKPHLRFTPLSYTRLMRLSGLARGRPN